MSDDLKTFVVRWTEKTSIKGWVEASSIDEAADLFRSGDVWDTKTGEGEWDGEGFEIEDEDTGEEKTFQS